MNWDQLQGKWKQMRGSLRRQWGRLTEDDLEVIAGNRDVLIGRVQERYGIAREEAENRIDQWLHSLQGTPRAHGTSPQKAFSGKP
jgi:uncharacterized protein YjbJ (UPF0337 family)